MSALDIPAEPGASLARRLRVWLAWKLASALAVLFNATLRAFRVLSTACVLVRGEPVPGSEGERQAVAENRATKRRADALSRADAKRTRKAARS